MSLIDNKTAAETLAKQLPHLTLKERTGLTDLVKRLYQHYGFDLRRVVLFGSKARGDFYHESDLDVLVVVRMASHNYWRYWNEITTLVWQIELEYDLVISLLVENEPDYAIMSKHELLLTKNIERDGIELWTMPPNEPIFKPG